MYQKVALPDFFNFLEIAQVPVIRMKICHHIRILRTKLQNLGLLAPGNESISDLIVLDLSRRCSWNIFREPSTLTALGSPKARLRNSLVPFSKANLTSLCSISLSVTYSLDASAPLLSNEEGSQALINFRKRTTRSVQRLLSSENSFYHRLTFFIEIYWDHDVRSSAPPSRSTSLFSGRLSRSPRTWRWPTY